MADNPFRSPSIYEREMEVVNAPQEPFGTPAGVIGSSIKGPAFVPVLLGDWKDFLSQFGEPSYDDGNIGPYAVKEFLKNANAAVFTRVLGAGYDERNSGTRNTPGAGVHFSSSSYGMGGVYFLGALFSSGTANATYLSRAALPYSGTNDGNNSFTLPSPLIKAMLVADSGVSPMVKSENISTGPVGITGTYGSYENASSSFVLNLNGFTTTDESLYPSNVTASFDLSKVNHYSKVFNTDMTKIDLYGYSMYADFGMGDLGTNSLMVVTGANYIGSNQSLDIAQNVVFCLSGALPTTSTPDFNNFEDRYSAPISPFVISQDIGGQNYQLFRVEALSDGEWANSKLKLSVRDIKKSTSDTNDFGTFTLLVRDFNDLDSDQTVLEQYRNLDLDPSSENYIVRRIGDRNVYFDHDQSDEEDQRLVFEGDFVNKSNLIRIVPTDNLKNGKVPDEALPFGFDKFFMLRTSGSLDTLILDGVSSSVEPVLDTGNPTIRNLGQYLNHAVVPPIPMRTEISQKGGNNKKSNTKLFWGVQFERVVNGTTTAGVDQPNKSLKAEPGIANGYVKFLGNPQVANSTTAYESPVYVQTETPSSGSVTVWNNKFVLSNVAVATSSGGTADRTKIEQWRYVRDGVIPAGSRSFSVATDLNTNTDLAKFSFFMQYGWDGVNITKESEKELDQTALFKAAANDGWDTNVANAYRVAVRIMTQPENTDINLLAIPDIRDKLITDYATEMCEDRFDCMYIMDIENVGDSDLKLNSITSSVAPLVSNTVTTFEARGVDSNFAAAYWPDVKIFDDITNKMINVPPSVAVLGAFAFNDKVAFPWFAPAGFNRSSLENVTSVRVVANRDDRDKLYDANINPIMTQPAVGAVIFGQKTLQQAQSALDRVNVRRLMIELRRAVKSVAQRILFDQNRVSTWNRFVGEVNPILERIKEQAGIKQYKLVADESTTSQADIDNNIFRVKLFVFPNKSVEFIALDFTLVGDGSTIFSSS